MDYVGYAKRLGEAPDGPARQQIQDEFFKEGWGTAPLYPHGETLYGGYLEPPQPDRHQVTMMLSDDEWTMLDNLIDSRIEHHKHYITRAERHPSETVRSSMTIDRHWGEIRKWERIQEQLRDNAW